MIDKLAELAELAPEMCQFIKSPNGDYYLIGDYCFWGVHDELAAQSNDEHYIEMYKGKVALDWLQVALSPAIEARGWYWRLARGDDYAAEIWPPVRYGVGATAAEALLDALLTAVRETGK